MISDFGFRISAFLRISDFGLRIFTILRAPYASTLLTLLTLLTPPTATPAASGPPPKPAPIKIIFDTDIGNDVDDVLALSVLHALQTRGDCELLAVTITNVIRSGSLAGADLRQPDQVLSALIPPCLR